MADSENFGEQFEDFIDEMVNTGHYPTREAVLGEMARLLRLREQYRAELDAALQEGLADATAGRVIPADELLAYFEEKYAVPMKEQKA